MPVLLRPIAPRPWVVLFTFLALLFGTAGDVAALQVGGSLVVDTHWRVTDSPVLVTADLSVDGGATLTIETGVTVYLTPGISIAVSSGGIKAVGTAASPIRFTSAKLLSGGLAAPGDWGAFRILAGSGAASTIEHAVIEYGQGVVISGASPSLNYVAINKHNAPAITMDLAASPRGLGNSAVNNTLNGILVPPGEITQSATWGLRGIPYVVATGSVAVGSAPHVDRFSPNTLQQGDSALFTLTGSRLTGLERATFDKAGLSADLQSGGSDTSVPLRISTAVDSPTGGVRFSASTDAGDISLADAFYVIPRLPQLSRLNPATVTVGQGSVPLEVIGSRLTADVAILVAGNPIATSYADASKVSGVIPNQMVAGNLSVRVRTPDAHNPGSYYQSNDLLLAVAAQPLVLAPGTLSLTQGTSQNLNLQLSYPAPDGGVTINLASANSAVATVPATILFPAGNSSQNIAVLGVGVGTAAITASRTGFVSATAGVTVVAPPALGVSPAYLAIPPDNLPHSFAITLTKADTVDRSISVATGNTAVAVVSPASAVIPVGATRAVFQITGKTLGQTVITAGGAGLTSFSGPVFVTNDYLGMNTTYSLPVGVRVGDSATQPSTLNVFSPSAEVGVTLGSAWLSTTPRVVGQGTSGILTLTGRDIPGNLALAFNPATGLTLGSVSVAADGMSATVPYTVAGNAVASTRQLIATAGSKVLVPANVNMDRVTVVPPPPLVYSIAPIVGVPGALISNFTVIGRNLGGGSVLFIGGGTVVGSPTINSDGTSLSVAVQIEANAAIGPRTVVVRTAAGESSGIADSTNTFTIAGASTVGPTYSALSSAPVGVVFGSSGSTTNASFGLQSPLTGVLLGSGITSRIPYSGATGDTITLVLGGQGLAAVNSIAFSPADGLSVGTVTTAQDGSSITVPIAIAGNASLGQRRIIAKAGSTVIPFANPSGDRLLVTPPMPTVSTISPIVLKLGSTATTLNLTGRNFQNAGQVRLTPPDGATVTLGSVSADGSSASASVTIAANAAAGPRVVSIVTPAGESELVLGPNNTLTLSETAGTQYSGLVSRQVGVQVGAGASGVAPFSTMIPSSLVGVTLASSQVPGGNRYGLLSPQVGVGFGATALAASPTVLRLGETLNLVVQGRNLPATTTLALSPASGLTLQGGAIVSPDGTSITQAVAVAANALGGPRQVRVMNGSALVPFSDLARSVLQVVPAVLPSLDSISPILAHQGDTLLMTIRGANFGNLVSVAAEPATGILFSNPSASADGSQVSVALQLAPDAPTGARTIRVITLSGTSSGAASATNTFTIYIP